ncbi:hypothetical protein JCM30394_30270 [Deferrisoma palaeochoriense]
MTFQPARANPGGAAQPRHRICVDLCASVAINRASIQARKEIARAWSLLPAVRECGIRLTLHPALSRMDGTTQEL